MKKNKNFLILFTIVAFVACGKKENLPDTEVNVHATTNDSITMIQTDTIVPDKEEKRFNEYALDSIVEKVFGEHLIQKTITNIDSIKQYKPLVDLFGTKGLKNITYKFSNNDIVDLFGIGYVPGRINKMVFNTVEEAQKSYSKFMNDFYHHKYDNEGFFEFKAGLICLMNDNAIYLIPVISCTDKRDLNRVWDVVITKVVAPSSKGIKMYCALDEYELAE